MENEETQFDKEYVGQLRAEAANYRTKVRDLESKLDQYSKLDAEIKAVRVENELTKRGVQADPRWIQIDDNTDPATAVDSFLEKYPHLKPQTDEANSSAPNIRESPEPLKGQNSPNPAPKISSGAFQGRSVEEIKADPAARRNLADLYKELLAQNSNQGE